MCKISVITVLKRRHKKIKENLNSLLHQTLSDVEIICIYKEENKTIDKIVKEYENEFPGKIKIINKTKAQDVIAKNQALQEAKGKYLLITNGNECFDKTILEKLYNSAEKNKSDISICGYNRIDINSNQIINSGLDKLFGETAKVDGKNKAWGYLNLEAGNKLIKKDKIGEIKFQNYDECQDEIFILSYYSNIKEASFVHEILYYTYKDVINKNLLKSMVQIKDFQKGLVEVKNIYREAGIYGTMQNMLSLIAFLKVGVKSLIEISYDKNNDLKENIREIMNYLDVNFFEWRKNKYLKFGEVPQKVIWVAHTMYKFGFQSVFIKVYRYLIDNGESKLIF